MARPGGITHHHCPFSTAPPISASCRICPHVTIVESPSPRTLIVDSYTIAPGTYKAIDANAYGTSSGTICLKIIRRLDAPNAFDASMYVSSLICSPMLRTVFTGPTQKNALIIRISVQSDGLNTALMTISRGKSGMLRKISNTRCMIASTQPPAYALTTPYTTPTDTATTAVSRPISSAQRMPATTPLQRSRRELSVPSQPAALPGSRIASCSIFPSRAGSRMSAAMRYVPRSAAGCRKMPACACANRIAVGASRSFPTRCASASCRAAKLYAAAFASLSAEMRIG